MSQQASRRGQRRRHRPAAKFSLPGLILLTVLVALTLASAAAASPGPASRGASPPGLSGSAFAELVVRLEAGASPELIARTLSGAHVVDSIPQIGIYRVRVPETEPAPHPAEDKAKRLRGQNGVRFANPMSFFRTSAIDVLNDPGYPAQWWLAAIGVPEVWGRPEAVLAPIVAVVDTGFDVGGLDFAGRVTGARNFTGSGGATDVYDADQHGTKVAGIILAEGNNRLGIAGVHWQARLMPLKAGTDGRLMSFAAAKAIVYAVDNGARVINLSWGFHKSAAEAPDVATALGYASAAGALSVASAGNIEQLGDGALDDWLVYPASDPNTLAVGSVSRSLVRSPFSCFGPQLDLVAPGGGAPQNLEGDYITTLDAGGAVFSARGTSYSAPMVSGAASLLLAARPGLSAQQLETLLTVTATDLGPSGWDEEYGAGLLDVEAAFSAALAQTPTFSDVSLGQLYEEQIIEIARRGIVQGFLDGTFRPQEKVMRQQFAKMIVLTRGLHTSTVDHPSSPTFRDVLYTGDPYPYDYIEEAAAAGIVRGYSDGKFGPYSPVTRAQLITMVARAANVPALPVGSNPPFPEFDQEHYPWAARAHAAGLLEGMQGLGDTYDFYSPASRGEVCRLLFNLLD